VGLDYPGEWKFEGIGVHIPNPAVNEFRELIVSIAEGSKGVIEDFKSAFGGTSFSTSFDWAVADLDNLLSARASNAVDFLDRLWSGIESAEREGLKVPPVGR
jgi:hypothetical protein